MISQSIIYWNSNSKSKSSHCWN